MNKTMTWSEMQQHVDDSVSLYEMSIVDILTVFKLRANSNDFTIFVANNLITVDGDLEDDK